MTRPSLTPVALPRPTLRATLLAAVVLLLLYGSVLWGILPGTPGVSWQVHLFGALAGVLAARLVASADRRVRPGTPPAGPVSPSSIGP